MKAKQSVIKQEPFKQIINDEYQYAKRALRPLLKGVNRSFIKFYWLEEETKIGGSCNKKNRVIKINKNYRDQGKGKWSLEMFKMTIRHEICHLVEANHGKQFLRYLELLGGHRYIGQEVYERTKKK